MKEYGASKQEAYVKFQKDVTNVWKDINKEFFRPTEVPMFVLERVLNLARVVVTNPIAKPTQFKSKQPINLFTNS